MFAVRSSEEHYTRPYVLSTSEKVTNFFLTSFNQLPSIWVSKLEAFALYGIEG